MSGDDDKRWRADYVTSVRIHQPGNRPCAEALCVGVCVYVCHAPLNFAGASILWQRDNCGSVTHRAVRSRGWPRAAVARIGTFLSAGTGSARFIPKT